MRTGDDTEDYQGMKHVMDVKWETEGKLIGASTSAASRTSTAWTFSYNCGLEGHVSHDCTAEAKPKTCYKCGLEEHIVRFPLLFLRLLRHLSVLESCFMVDGPCALWAYVLVPTLALAVPLVPLPETAPTTRHPAAAPSLNRWCGRKRGH
ncbi:hypothetical protein B0H11DRAFT_2272261 [Mycena galericulata]|nr:hypothetical protein B0H11DRAFT_2272261 [Mycena galericulata]